MTQHYELAPFPNEKILLCTGDKDLALFWAGVRASDFAWNSGCFVGHSLTQRACRLTLVFCIASENIALAFGARCMHRPIYPTFNCRPSIKDQHSMFLCRASSRPLGNRRMSQIAVL